MGVIMKPILYIYSFIFCLTQLIYSQQAGMNLIPYNLSTESYNGNGLDKPSEVFNSIVSYPEAISLRLKFGSANLGKGSYIIVKSVEDSSWQKLNSVSIEQWGFTSAYFNGDSVVVSLYIAPGDKNIYFDISGFFIDKKSIPPKEILSKTVSKVNSAQNFCTDDGRALSNDSAVCRFFIQPNELIRLCWL